MGNSNDNSGSGNGGKDVYKRRAEPVLVSLSDLYLDNDSISVGNNQYSSCPVYTIYWLLLSTDYCPKGIVNDFSLRRLFYSK